MNQVGGVNSSKGTGTGNQRSHPLNKKDTAVSGLVHSARLLEGAANTHRCMNLRAEDRLLIITDQQTEPIAKALELTATATQNILVLKLEDFGARPMSEFPDAMKAAIDEFKPTASIFAAYPQENEVPMRQGMIEHLVKELNVRHAHMVFITDDIMEGAMRGNAQEVYALTMHVYELVSKAKTMTVTTDNGTKLTAEFDPNITWIDSHPLIREQGKWGNLPNGEVFTCPLNVKGTIVVDGVLGDYLSPEFGVLGKENALTLKIADSQIVSIEGKNAEVVEAFKAYLANGDENSCRVGEWAIGTNLGITELIGNMLSDEKSPGFHMAFGDPYGSETGADWKSKTHIDVIPVEPTITVDGKEIMRRGNFSSALLEEVHLSHAARNVVETALAITNNDRVLIFTDDTTLEVAKALEQNLGGVENVGIVRLEGYRANGPLTSIPPAVSSLITSFKPTATIYAASAPQEEKPFADALITLLIDKEKGMNARHAHMPGITPQIMRKALRGDIEQVSAFTADVLRAMRKDPTTVKVTSPLGTDLKVRFYDKINWVTEIPLIHEQGWAYVPAGRVYSSPESINGTLVIDGVIHGPRMSRHGMLGAKNAVTVEISEGRIRRGSIRCDNREIKADFEADLDAGDRNGTRVGLFAIGTNTNMTELTGNPLSDMSAPYLQIVLGNPQQEKTGTYWNSSSEISLIMQKATLSVGWKTVMANGEFSLG